LEVNTPILLLHGTADWRVPTTDPIRLALKLQELHKTYSLHIYADDVHGLPLHNEEVHQKIADWFRQYMK
jgi:dipeptidyl aminopeptidase/acylaminoacyl peptidase